MSEELNLVKDLAVILISAGVCTVLCKALKQPLMLGYLIAGFLISPNLGIFGISSMETVNQWSEIGLIFLMFALGLEFSIKKLLAAGSTAISIAGSKFLGVFVIGFTVGQALGWSMMESIFLGGLLSMSSTAVIVKTYQEMGIMEKPYAPMVFGSLVVEDIIAIILMVLLSGLAVSNKFSGGEMIFNLAKLAFFLILWFLVGIYLIPTALRWARQYINDEILLIVSLGLCFGMVSLATGVGFSSALGAFVMGSILAETIEGEHVDSLVLPIKNLFGAIFFISVGMMISPKVIGENWKLILLLTVIVVIAHVVLATIGTIVAGRGLDNAVHVGFSHATLGEFAFIIASVGVSLGVMREFIYPVIIAVSVISIFVSPYVMKLADPAYDYLCRKLPDKWMDKLQTDQRAAGASTAEKGEWKNLLTAYGLRILLYGVILIAIMLLSKNYLDDIVAKLFPKLSDFVQRLISTGITLSVMAPFLYGLAISSGSINKSARKLLDEKPGNIWPISGLVIVRSFLAVSMVLVVVLSHFHMAGWAVVALLFAGILFVIMSRHYLKVENSLEERFMENFTARERKARADAPVKSSVSDSLGEYDVHIEEIRVSSDSKYAGKHLRDIPIRQESGANIIKIVRGGRNMNIPGPDVQIFPSDKLFAVGTTPQIAALRNMLKESVEIPDKEKGGEKFEVRPLTLTADSYLTGKSLRSVSMRDYGCMLISLLRDGEFMTNPKPDIVFKEGDVVWIAGAVSSLDWMN